MLLRFAATLREEDARMAAALDPQGLDRILALVPDAWLDDGADGLSVADTRAAYRRYLLERLESPRHFVEETIGVR